MHAGPPILSAFQHKAAYSKALESSAPRHHRPSCIPRKGDAYSTKRTVRRRSDDVSLCMVGIELRLYGSMHNRCSPRGRVPCGDVRSVVVHYRNRVQDQVQRLPAALHFSRNAAVDKVLCAALLRKRSLRIGMRDDGDDAPHCFGNLDTHLA